MNDSPIDSRRKRVFEKVRGYPGVFRVLVWNPEREKHVDPRSVPGCGQKPFRAMRRVRVMGKMVQQCKHFDAIQDGRNWTLESTEPEEVHRKATFTIRQLIAEWLEWSKPPRKTLSTWQTDRNKLLHLEALYDVPVEELTADDIDRWLMHVMSPEYPKKTIRISFEKELKVLSAMLHWYREYRNERYHPPILRRHRRDCYLRRKPPKPNLALSPEDLERVLKRLREHHRPVYYYLASFQAFTGARIGEACGLLWDAVDLKHGVVEIRKVCEWDHFSREPALREGTKTGQARVVLLPPRLIEVLKEWKREGAVGPIVFHKKGELLHYPAIQNCYKKVYRALGLPDRSTHVFRHTFGTIHAHQTRDIRATQAAMGHQDLRVTEHYAKVALATQERALGDFVLGQIQRKKRSSTRNERRIVH